MALTIPFNEIVEFTDIFLDSDWFAKLINTFQLFVKLYGFLENQKIDTLNYSHKNGKFLLNKITFIFIVVVIK